MLASEPDRPRHLNWPEPATNLPAQFGQKRIFESAGMKLIGLQNTVLLRIGGTSIPSYLDGEQGFVLEIPVAVIPCPGKARPVADRAGDHLAESCDLNRLCVQRARHECSGES
jgi:hypothetical protein